REGGGGRQYGETVGASPRRHRPLPQIAAAGRRPEAPMRQARLVQPAMRGHSASEDARERAYDPRILTWAQNALKVMMVRVSWMPGMVCTFSLTKWPMSVLSST